MTDAIGTARVDIVVDTSQFDSAITAAKRSVSGMSQAAQAEYTKLNSAEKKRVDSLIQQADKLSLTREQQIAYNAALKNVPVAVLDDLKKKLAAVSASTANAGTSAKQLQFALRGVPAQFTDIATSLASGQKPLLVLLQQGGQLKDMFGGVGNAAKALGGYVLGLINPVTILAAGVAALAAAFSGAEEEQVAFNKALILTGNFAGTTASRLGQLAEQMDNLSGVTTASAAAALSEVTATGRFTGDQILQVATAAEQMRVATGKAVSETIAEFVKLRNDPVRAILELNDTYHFLTQAQFDHIRTLQEEGREQEAATEAFNTFAGAISRRAPQIVENLGTIETVWKVIKGSASEAWDAMLGIGRDKTVVQRANQLQEQIARAMARGFDTSGLEAELKKLQGEKHAAPPPRGGPSSGNGSVDSDAARAQIEFDKEGLRFATDKAKMENDIAKAKALGLAAGKSDLEIQKRINEIRAEYARNAPKAPKGAADPTDGIADRIRKQIALNNEEAGSEDKLTASERLAITVKQELIDLKGKGSEAGRKEIAVLLDTLNATGAVAAAHKQEIKDREDLRRLTEDLTAQEEARRRANEIELASVGHGDAYIAQMQQRLAIEENFSRQMEALEKRRSNLSEASYEAEAQTLRQSRDKMLNIEDDFQTDWAAAQGNWLNGLTRALEDYQSRAADVAGQVADMWSNGIHGLEDTLTDFFTTGKANWGDFLDSVLKDITRFIIRQQLSKWLTQLGGLFGGMNGNSTVAVGSGTMPGNIFPSANGNVFANGNVIPFANGGVVNRQSFFRMANGSTGSMAEGNKAEAIMPLERGANGKLGVNASGLGGGGVVVNIVNNGGGTARTEQRTEGGTKIIDVFIEAAKNAVAQDIGRNGTVGKAIGARYGVQPAGVVRG